MDNANAPTESELVQKLQASRTQESSDSPVNTDEVTTNEVTETETTTEDVAVTDSVDEPEDNNVDKSTPWRTIKADGEDHGLTEDEYDSYASKGYNYTQKTMAHAEKVKTFEASSAAEMTKLNGLTEQLASLITEQEKSIDWDELRDTDPSEYLKQKELIQLKKDTLVVAKQEQQSKFEAQRAEISTQEGISLRNHMSWLDDKAMNKDMAEAASYMKTIGITESDQSNIVDHRLFRMAFDAAKYQILMKNKGKVTEQIKKAPKSVKQGQKTAPDQSELDAARSKFKNSGGRSEADGVALMKARRGK